MPSTAPPAASRFPPSPGTAAPRAGRRRCACPADSLSLRNSAGWTRRSPPRCSNKPRSPPECAAARPLRSCNSPSSAGAACCSSRSRRHSRMHSTAGAQGSTRPECPSRASLFYRTPCACRRGPSPESPSAPGWRWMHRPVCPPAGPAAWRTSLPGYRRSCPSVRRSRPAPRTGSSPAAAVPHRPGSNRPPAAPAARC